MLLQPLPEGFDAHATGQQATRVGRAEMTRRQGGRHVLPVHQVGDLRGRSLLHQQVTAGRTGANRGVAAAPRREPSAATLPEPFVAASRAARTVLDGQKIVPPKPGSASASSSVNVRTGPASSRFESGRYPRTAGAPDRAPSNIQPGTVRVDPGLTAALAVVSSRLPDKGRG